jgi:predicted enzyme related to lactoylglutathione lyase
MQRAIVAEEPVVLRNLISINTILYCRHWHAMVRFYRDQLQLPVNFSTDWFIEFDLTPNARLSIADENRSTIKSSSGNGITLTFQVEEIESVHKQVEDLGLMPTAIRKHQWQAMVFYLIDPEGNRLEVWQSIQSDKRS